jgi:hypothetical protein
MEKRNRQMELRISTFRLRICCRLSAIFNFSAPPILRVFALKHGPPGARNSCRWLLPRGQKRLHLVSPSDSLSSRHGKSSGELVSVMILGPVFGNSLEFSCRLPDWKSHE